MTVGKLSVVGECTKLAYANQVHPHMNCDFLYLFVLPVVVSPAPQATLRVSIDIAAPEAIVVIVPQTLTWKGWSQWQVAMLSLGAIGSCYMTTVMYL